MHEIVIVGGGFAGFWAAVAAKRIAGEQAAVVLVSRDPALQMRPRLYEANPETLGIDIRPLLHKIGARFVQAEAVGLDPSGHTIALSNGRLFPYARLVVATGSALRRPDVPGADEVFSIDTQREAIAFDRRLAHIARDVPCPAIAIVGAGFTGIELALEMRDRLAAHGGADAADRARIILVNRASIVGRELGPGPRPVIEDALAAARVELMLGKTITALSVDTVTFDDGSVRNAHAVVLTTGMTAASFASVIPGERDRLGRVHVDQMLRVPAAPDIFVTGDAAAADTGDGNYALQSCQHALQLGPFAGENAARDLLGLPLIPYAQQRYVTCLDLGRSGAVFTEGWDRIVQFSGAEAKARKRNINTVVIYPPSESSSAELLALSDTDPANQG